MPKKPPQNAFYFFMMDFRKEQKLKGINYSSLKFVAEAAGPVWAEMSPQMRAKYEAIAKSEKQKSGGLDNKYTSTGIPLSVIDQHEREAREAMETECKDIKNMVKLKTLNRTILEENFYVMDVNALCTVGNDHYIGEFTILQFNVQDGIKNCYHEMVNPGGIPTGFAFDVKENAMTLGLKVPDEMDKKSNYMQILANIIDYLKKNDRNVKTLPPIFTLPEKVEKVQSFILQMCIRAEEDDSLFRIYKLDLLFFHLINNIKTQPNEGFPKESLATAHLLKDVFKYTPGLACEHHEAMDMGNECTSSRVKRWAFTVLDACCPLAGVAPAPARHLPQEYDVNSILMYKEEKQARAAPSVAAKASTSICSSVCNESLTESACASGIDSVKQNVKKERRVHTPMRMPKTDYSQRIQLAPDLTEENFPSLMAGSGRGRGLAGSLNRMNIRK